MLGGLLERARSAVPSRLRARLGPLVGRHVRCPCCGLRVRRFEPFGVARRPNARCPRCGSLERHRLLWLYLRSEPGLLERSRLVLHVAPEPALAELLGRQGVRTVAVDLHQPDVDVRADLTALPFRADAFDAVLANHVLEHVPDDRAAMTELARVLAPGGWAVLQSPVDPRRAVTFEDPSVTDPLERERLFGQNDHVRVYGRDYAARLTGAGFAVKQVPSADSRASRRYGLDPTEELVVCRPSGGTG